MPEPPTVLLNAESPRYRALYDPSSGVSFSRGRAQVTEEQALQLAERRFVDGILIEGVPAKHWARDRGRRTDGPGDVSDDPVEKPADQPPATKTRKAR